MERKDDKASTAIRVSWVGAVAPNTKRGQKERERERKDCERQSNSTERSCLLLDPTGGFIRIFHITFHLKTFS